MAQNSPKSNSLSPSGRFYSSKPSAFASSPNRKIVMSRKPAVPVQPKQACLCSPTNHPGSFRCSLHRNSNSNNLGAVRTTTCNNLERRAMVNLMVGIRALEGDLKKYALASLIRPSSTQLRRHQNFQPRPSRLSVMSKD